MLSAWLGLPPWRVLQREGRSGARFRVHAPHVALTFDDGPHEERTPRVLDLLARSGVRATFFLVGERAERHAGIVERMAREGHVLGNHGWSHRWLVGAAEPAAREEVDRCQSLLAALGGVPPTLLRPAYGWTTPVLERLTRERALTPVFWSVDTLDYAAAPAAVVHWRARSARRGDVVLFHDGAEQARGTLPALERFLAFAREREIALGPFPQVTPTSTVTTT